MIFSFLLHFLFVFIQQKTPISTVGEGEKDKIQSFFDYSGIYSEKLFYKPAYIIIYLQTIQIFIS